MNCAPNTSAATSVAAFAANITSRTNPVQIWCCSAPTLRKFFPMPTL